ncbi:sigma intracellular receptor 2, partial [Phenoliferia sp. Uapishka_3]
MVSQAFRDTVYMWFLILHIPATLVIDIQALFFAESVSPAFLRQPFLYARRDDPLLQNANSPLFAWFQSFIILETIFQLPVFFLGIQGLRRGSRSIYPLLAIYGASSATTTWACLATVLTMPGITHQLPVLLASYVPFLLVPLAMAVDYGIRLAGIARVAAEKGKYE